MAKDKRFNLEIVTDHSGETVFLLELVDLVEEFEKKCEKTLPEEERFDLLRQLFILLESHRPDDLTSRQLLFYDLMPTLLSKKEDEENDMLRGLYNARALELMVKIHKRLHSHYLYDSSHRALFTHYATFKGDVLLLLLNPLT